MTYIARFVDVCFRETLLGAVARPSPTVVDSQQVSSHIVLRSGNLCIEKQEVRHCRATQKLLQHFFFAWADVQMAQKVVWCPKFCNARNMAVAICAHRLMQLQSVQLG